MPMSDTMPISEGRFITTRYDGSADEMTLIIESAEHEVLLNIAMPMDEARRLARWLAEGLAEDSGLTPEEIIHGGSPELN